MNDFLETHRSAMSYILLRFSETNEEYTEDSVKSFVDEVNGMFGFDQETVNQICKYLESNFDINQNSGFSVKNEFKPWIKGADITYHYWGRYLRYLTMQGRPLKATRKLTEITVQSSEIK